MADLNKTYLYRMTHINNVAHVLRSGITHVNSSNANPNYTPIGDPTLITRRSSFVLNNGNRLGDYIPFYFGVRTPMLYVIKNGFNNVPSVAAEDIVYCITSVQKIVDHNLEFVFTDGHAVESFSSQFGLQDLDSIDSILDKNAIKAKYWTSDSDLDLKRRKEAEFLVLGDIPSEAVLGFVVANNKAETRLKDLGIVQNRISVQPTFYF